MLQEITLGWLGMHPWEVEQYSLNQLAFKISGHIDQQQAQRLDNWKQTRLVVATLYNTAGKSFKKMLKPEQLIKLPTDVKVKSGLEEMREAYKIMQKNG